MEALGRRCVPMRSPRNNEATAHLPDGMFAGMLSA